MPEIFLIIAGVLALIVALLTLAPQLRVLNFVDYRSDRAVVRLNRYAAARLAVPIVVNLGSACVAFAWPEYTLPLVFLAPVSILSAVIWIAAGANGVNLRAELE
ncbi:MAG: hypothetical protein AB1807_09095 [Pseudomonadota bacterium]